MRNEIFEQQLSLSLQRLEELWKRADQLPKPPAPLWQEATANLEAPQNLLIESLTELGNSLEELQVVVEELHQQNHELNSSRMAVEAERQHYQELFEFAPDGYLVTTPAGVILEANQMAGDLLNVSQRRLVGKPLVIFITAEERRNFYSKLNQLQKGELIRNWQVQIKRRRGAGFIASIAVSPIQNPQGKVERLRWRILELTPSPPIDLIPPQSVNQADGKKHDQNIASIDDGHNFQDNLAAENQHQIIETSKFNNQDLSSELIPQLEMSNQHLIASIKQIESVLNNILYGACDFLFICDHQEKYIYVNQATANAWGLEQSNFIGKSWEILKLPKEMVERLEAQQEAVFSTGRSFTDETSLITKAGLKDYEYTMTKISDINSRLDAVVVTFRNLTLPRQPATMLNVDLEPNKTELSILKSSFTWVFTQELPHPLHNILTAIKSLKNNTQQEVDAQGNHELQIIQVNIRRINQLLDDLLFIENIESQQLQLKPALIDLTEFCRKLIEELKQDTGSQPTITFVRQGKPCGVWDQQLLRRIIINLLLNAINYSLDSRDIQLNVTCIGKQIILCIQYSGNGSQEIEQDLLFPAFADTINIDEMEINKLRLIISKYCVELQQGNFLLETKQDNDTIITVILPMNQRAKKKN